MDRRNFLKGTFGGIVGGGVILAASDADVAAFASGGTGIGQEMVSSHIPMAPVPMEGHILFNSKGDPVAVVTRIQWCRDPVDCTPIDSQRAVYVDGLPRVRLEATMFGTTYLKGYQGQFIMGQGAANGQGNR